MDYIRNRKISVRLRMLLEAKKDGRRKGRLVLQGFRASATAVRMPIIEPNTPSCGVDSRDQPTMTEGTVVTMSIEPNLPSGGIARGSSTYYD